MLYQTRGMTLVTKPNDLSSIPGIQSIWWKEKTTSHKLSSGLHTVMSAGSTGDVLSWWSACLAFLKPWVEFPALYKRVWWNMPTIPVFGRRSRSSSHPHLPSKLETSISYKDLVFKIKEKNADDWGAIS